MENLDREVYLSYDKWQIFSIMSLSKEVLEYSTFKRMKDNLLEDHSKSAMKLFRSEFLTTFEAVRPTNCNLANLLASEGVLVSDENLPGYFNLSSPLVR